MQQMGLPQVGVNSMPIIDPVSSVTWRRFILFSRQLMRINLRHLGTSGKGSEETTLVCQTARTLKHRARLKLEGGPPRKM